MAASQSDCWISINHVVRLIFSCNNTLLDYNIKAVENIFHDEDNQSTFLLIWNKFGNKSITGALSDYLKKRAKQEYHSQILYSHTKSIHRFTLELFSFFSTN